MSEQDELITHEGRTATFSYNKNLAGIVVINDIQGNEVEVSGDDLIIFIAEAYIRPKLLECINNTSSEDLLFNRLEPFE